MAGSPQPGKAAHPKKCLSIHGGCSEQAAGGRWAGWMEEGNLLALSTSTSGRQNAKQIILVVEISKTTYVPIND